MANAKQWEGLKEGVEVWNEDRAKNLDVRIDPSETDFIESRSDDRSASR